MQSEKGIKTTSEIISADQFGSKVYQMSPLSPQRQVYILIHIYIYIYKPIKDDVGGKQSLHRRCRIVFCLTPKRTRDSGVKIPSSTPKSCVPATPIHHHHPFLLYCSPFTDIPLPSSDFP